MPQTDARDELLDALSDPAALRDPAASARLEHLLIKYNVTMTDLGTGKVTALGELLRKRRERRHANLEP
jgi:hypothetical protein